MSRFEPEEWTSEEARSLGELSEGRLPDPLLEERLVGELRQRGLLMKRRTLPRALRWAGAIAASLALFASGMLTGYRAGASSVDTFGVPRADVSVAERARLVQRTASQHVAALAALGEVDANSASDALAQGREAAFMALFASALELAKIDPDNQAVQRVLDAFAGVAVEDESPPTPAAQLIWF